MYTIYTKIRNYYYYNFHPETRPKLNVVQKSTDLCIEGFPRSGNTYLENLIKKMAPSLNLVSHKHSSGHVKEALHLGVPIVIIVRDPADAVTSQFIWTSRGEGSDAPKIIKHYIQFYSYVELVKKQVILVDFSSLTENVSISLEKINSILHLWPNETNYDKVTADVLKEMKKKQKTEDIFKSSTPSDQRDKRKWEVKNHLLETFYDEMKPAYIKHEILLRAVDEN